MKPIRTAFAAAAAAALLAGCQSVPSDVLRATASLEPTRGSSVSGAVDFVQVGDKVRVSANVRGLKPNGEFGFQDRKSVV